MKKLLAPIGEHVEVRMYERKTPLTIATEGLGSLDNVRCSFFFLLPVVDSTWRLYRLL